MRVLVAEDTEDSRVLLDVALKANGYTVETAENGKQALELIRKIKPDLIISDILMPEMDGYSLCRAIKNDAFLRDIPFIFYTATYTTPQDESLAMALGASKFIVKPMEMEIFLKEIENVIREHEAATLVVPQQTLASGEELERYHTDALNRKLNEKVLALEEERRKLKESKEKYQRLVEAIRQDYFFYSRDPNGIFTYVSPSITNILGYTQDEFLVHYAAYLTENPVNDKVAYYAEQACQGERQPQYELEIFHKDGSIHILEILEEPLCDQKGEVMTVEGIAHDVTKSRQAERQNKDLLSKLRQAQKMEAIGTLAGGIAHDFNNILTPIIGYAEIALSPPSGNEENTNCLNEILTAGNRAKELVKQILTFSRHAEEEMHVVHLQPLIKEILKLLRASIPTTIEFRENLSATCDKILANPTQIHQLMMNLCTNAYQAMLERGGVLTVAMEDVVFREDDYIVNLALKPGKYLRLTVGDTGCGIEPEIREKIFEPYFSTKTKDQGTGLGLSVVHGIVKSHRGHINVYSEVGKGTTFKVYLPCEEESQSFPVSQSDMTVIGGSEHILLVDDEQIITKMEKQMLETLGYRVSAFTSSEEAWREFEQNPKGFDLIITDMTMPFMNGAELAEKILVVRPSIPIILCSGFSDIIDEKRSKELGIREYMVKPLLRRELGCTIRKVLAGQ